MGKWEPVTLLLSLFVEPKGHCEQARGGFFPWRQTKLRIKLGEVCLQVKMKRTLAALGENISSGMFSAAVFHYTWNSSGDKDLMCITAEPAPRPCHFLLQRKREGKTVQEAMLSLSFPFFFLPHSPFGRKENTSTKKVPLILPKLQKTPNPGPQVSFWSIPVTFHYSSN